MIIKQCLIKTYVLPPPSPHLIIDNKLNWSVQESDTFYHNMPASLAQAVVKYNNFSQISFIRSQITIYVLNKYYPQLSFLSAERIIALTTSLLFSVPVGHLRHVSRKLLVSSGLWSPQSTVQNRKYSLEIILLTWGNLVNIKSSINPSLSTSPDAWVLSLPVRVQWQCWVNINDKFCSQLVSRIVLAISSVGGSLASDQNYAGHQKGGDQGVRNTMTKM